MKAIISDFTRSAKIGEMKQRDGQLRHGGFTSEEAHNVLVAPSLEQSDHVLARDIVITDMQTRIHRLKRKVTAEQQQHKRETVEVRDKLKDLADRETELRTQNAYLRQAILDGRMGDKIDLKRFEELYAELVKVDEMSYSEEELEEVIHDEYATPASPQAQSGRPLSRAVSVASAGAGTPKLGKTSSLPSGQIDAFSKRPSSPKSRSTSPKLGKNVSVMWKAHDAGIMPHLDGGGPAAAPEGAQVCFSSRQCLCVELRRDTRGSAKQREDQQSLSEIDIPRKRLTPFCAKTTGGNRNIQTHTEYRHQRLHCKVRSLPRAVAVAVSPRVQCVGQNR